MISNSTAKTSPSPLVVVVLNLKLVITSVVRRSTSYNSVQCLQIPSGRLSDTEMILYVWPTKPGNWLISKPRLGARFRQGGQTPPWMSSLAPETGRLAVRRLMKLTSLSLGPSVNYVVRNLVLILINHLFKRKTLKYLKKLNIIKFVIPERTLVLRRRTKRRIHIGTGVMQYRAWIPRPDRLPSVRGDDCAAACYAWKVPTLLIYAIYPSVYWTDKTNACRKNAKEN